MMSPTSFDTALPVIFMALMGVAMLVYVISDGYDLGVGMLCTAPPMPRKTS